MEKEVCEFCGNRKILNCCTNESCVSNIKINKKFYKENYDENKRVELYGLEENK